MQAPCYDTIMNKKVLIGIVVVIAVAIFFITRNKNPDLPPVTGTTIIAFGDSLVSGTGSTKGNDFVSVLSSRTGIPIINAGIPGNTTKDALNRLSRDVLEQDPRVVIIVIGGNDFLRRVPKGETLANVRSIIEQVQETGARVILVGTSRLVYNDDYKVIAQELGVSFVPHVLDRMLQDKRLMDDAIHPNDEGYKTFADAVRPYFLKAMQSK
jgi:acyl-CoA thioesterase I